MAAEILRSGLRRATVGNRGVVVLCGAALKNKGVQPLLDAVVDYLPSPQDMPPVEAERLSDGAIVRRGPSPNEPLLALAFKVIRDAHRGPVVFLRVYSGTLRLKDAIHNVTRDRKERVQKLLQIHANKTSEIDEVSVGSIAAAVGLKFTVTGDTLILMGDDEKVVLRGMEIPDPVIFQAVEAKTTSAQPALKEALDRFQREDPSFTVREDPDSGQTLICGQGELHLEVVVDRMQREHGVEVHLGKPQVAYRETIGGVVVKPFEYDREIGGKRQYARIRLVLGPRERGTGNAFEIALPEPASGQAKLPKEFVEAVREGVGDAETRGPLLGYPVVDVGVQLCEAAHSESDSSDASFRAAAAMAMAEALEAANPRLLEPLMSIDVVVPEEYTGNVVSDLTGRRGRVMGMTPHGVAGRSGGSSPPASRTAAQVVKAEVPLAEMVGYATALRSATQGRASHSMQFSRYAGVPRELQASIVKGAGVY
jgi:elongation factor G